MDPNGNTNQSINFEEEKFKKEMVNSFHDLQRAQKAQQAELVEVKARLERTLDEKAKLAHELKSRDATLDSMAKQMAEIQDNCKTVNDCAASQAKELKRFMEMLTNEKMQVARERAENEKLVKMNNSLKENFVRANRCFNNMKIRYTDVDKTNAALRNHVTKQQKEFNDLRSQWLRDRHEQNKSAGNVESGTAKKLTESLTMAQMEITSLQEMLAAKTSEVDQFKEIESWIKKEHEEIEKLNEMSREIKEVLSRRANGGSDSVDMGDCSNTNGGGDDANGVIFKEVESDKEIDELTQKCLESERQLMEIMEKNPIKDAADELPRPIHYSPVIAQNSIDPRMVQPKTTGLNLGYSKSFETQLVEPKQSEPEVEEEKVEPKRDEPPSCSGALRKEDEEHGHMAASSLSIRPSPLKPSRFQTMQHLLSKPDELRWKDAQNHFHGSSVTGNEEQQPRPSTSTGFFGAALTSPKPASTVQEAVSRIPPMVVDLATPIPKEVEEKRPDPPSQGVAPFIPSFPSWLGGSK